MKLGICTNMIASGGDRLGLSHINSIAAAGFDYVELPMATIMSMHDTEFKKAVGEIRKSPLESTVVCSFMIPEVQAVGVDYRENRFIEYIKRSMVRAKELGVEKIVFGSPLSRSMMRAPYSLSETLAQLSHSIQIAMNYMEQYDICLLIEPLNRGETNVINTFKQGADFCRKTGRKGLYSMVDFAHFKMNGEPYSAIVENGEMLKHIHISRPFGRKFPSDEREEDYYGFFQALYQAGYDETISIEASSNHVFKDAKTAYKLLKKLIQKSYGLQPNKKGCINP